MSLEYKLSRIGKVSLISQMSNRLMSVILRSWYKNPFLISFAVVLRVMVRALLRKLFSHFCSVLNRWLIMVSDKNGPVWKQLRKQNHGAWRLNLGNDEETRNENWCPGFWHMSWVYGVTTKNMGGIGLGKKDSRHLVLEIWKSQHKDGPLHESRKY